MKDLTVVRGEIEAEWARTVDGDQVWRDSWRYEHSSGVDDKHLRIFRFESLANVSAMMTQRVFTPEAVRRFANHRHSSIINLAGEAPGRLTSTSLLLAGYLERPESQLDASIPEEARFEGPFGKFKADGNDTWVIPDTAVTLVEGQVLELQLPHQA